MLNIYMFLMKPQRKFSSLEYMNYSKTSHTVKGPLSQIFFDYT
jgi:hypothetical protein